MLALAFANPKESQLSSTNMRIQWFYGILFVEVILLPLSASSILKFLNESSSLSPFPPSFLFGASSSSYQYEGAYLSDGKGLSNWDVYTHQPGRITGGGNGDVSADQYHRYLEDVELISSLGLNSYRFSISWARILPKGRFGYVNQAGITYYNNLINALLLKGVQPFATLVHFDMPQELEDRYGGWLSPKSQEDFAYYANICFKHFGDRVKHWATLNEPNLSIVYSYRFGKNPPGRCSSSFGNCSNGDSETEPFVAAHNAILAHATAVEIYRNQYQKEQKGIIGITVYCYWYEPLTNSTADKVAVERARDFFINWILDPIICGYYPTEMRRILGSTLLDFSDNDKEKLKNGIDFIGINHYTSNYIEDCMFSTCEPGRGASRTEGFCKQSYHDKNGVPVGEPTDIAWEFVYPQGMEKMVTYIKERYNNIPMFITENGYGEFNYPQFTVEEFIRDDRRTAYITGYLDALSRAIRKGADVRGYFVWSLLDNFEWTHGFTLRYGLHHVDFMTLKRTPKLSAIWYKNFIARHKEAISRM